MSSFASKTISRNQQCRGRAGVASKEITRQRGFEAGLAKVVLHSRHAMKREDSICRRRVTGVQNKTVERVWTAVCAGRVLVGGGGASAAVGPWRVGHRRRRARRQVCAGRRDACGGCAGDRNISAPRCERGRAGHGSVIRVSRIGGRRARAGGAVRAGGIDYFRCGGGRIGHRNVSARRESSARWR